jgi:hypothetical protein
MEQLNIIILNEPERTEEINERMEKITDILVLTKTKWKNKGYKM